MYFIERNELKIKFVFTYLKNSNTIEINKSNPHFATDLLTELQHRSNKKDTFHYQYLK